MTLATPRWSDARFPGRCRLGSDGEPRQRRIDADAGHQEHPVAANLDQRPTRRDTPGHLRGGPVTACRQPRRLTRGVDTAHLHRDRAEPTGTQRQHSHERRDRERRLDRDRTPVIEPQTLVLSARLMMLLNAFTTESPVTTVYRIAPNAAEIGRAHV